jgi:RNA polymerase sigma-70 factor (ECF subfamily)
LNQDDLLERAKRWDMQALAEIYDRYSPALYAYAMRLLGDAGLAEDCVAESFSRLLNALKAGGGPQDHLQAYMYRIAHNWITDQYRRQPPPPLSLDDEDCVPAENSPETIASAHLQQEQVRAALQRLTPDQRQVVMLKFVEGWGNPEIAAAICKPVGAVKSLQHRALEALKRMLVVFEEQEYERLR